MYLRSWCLVLPRKISLHHGRRTLLSIHRQHTSLTVFTSPEPQTAWAATANVADCVRSACWKMETSSKGLNEVGNQFIQLSTWREHEVKVIHERVLFVFCFFAYPYVCCRFGWACHVYTWLKLWLKKSMWLSDFFSIDPGHADPSSTNASRVSGKFRWFYP